MKRRVCAFALVLGFILSMIPLNVFASEVNLPVAEATVAMHASETVNLNSIFFWVLVLAIEVVALLLVAIPLIRRRKR